MKDESYRILVVDDEEYLCEILKFNLEMEGYIVNTANSAEEALTLDIASYHLLLLDVMLGGMSGFALAKQLKSNATTAPIPIVFLTAKDTENDTVTGFTLGADDYIAKPFSIREVILRIKAVLRRTAHQNAIDNQNTLLYKGIIINLDQKTITVDGQNVSFSKTEYELLKLLLEERNRVFSRQQLIDRIWPSDVQVSDRTVDVNITRLRKKIGQYATHIATRQGFGYYFNA